MTRRVVIGPRSNGDVGVFVSPSGVDAYTAADSALILGISSRVSQLLLLGHVSSSQTVTLGFGAVPHVLLTSQQSLALPSATLSGVMRPSPMFTMTSDGHGGYTIGTADPSYADIASDGSYMVITAPRATVYAVYNRTMV